MKNNPYFKLIVSTTLGAFILISVFVMAAQDAKIDNLKEQLYVKQQNEKRATDYYSSTINLKTIRTEFNELQHYTVLKGSITQTHKYEYSADAILGIKKEMTLKGRGDIQYDVNVNLNDAILEADGKTLIVKVRMPYVDTDSIKIKDDTMLMEEIHGNFISNKYDGAQAQKFFMESFIASGKKNVADLYNTAKEQRYIKEVAEQEIRALISTLNLNNVTVRVQIIE